MKKFADNERLSLSALKQFVYCKRRFALMFSECEWGSNYKIVEGDILHERVDNPYFNEKRGDVHISRSVPIFSDSLNLYGIADIVEFIKDEQGVKISGKKGLWRLNPIEYKNGKPEKSNADNYQLCAQTMCLEEMFKTEIKYGAIFYGKIKRRVQVDFTDELRENVRGQVQKMHELLSRQEIPPKAEDQNCSLCSLIDVCMPNIFDKHKSSKEQILSSLRR
jgi:CRISPR-associated exonuclease Cas4